MSTRRIRRTRYASLFTRVGAFVIGTALLGATSPAFSLDDINFGMPSTSLGSALPRIAKEMGIFAKNGLNPKFVSLDSGSVASAALISGSVQCTLGGSSELVAVHSGGQEAVTIATAYGGLAATLVLSKATADKLGVSPTAPIAERMKALSGVTIATPSPTSPYTFALKAAAAKLANTELRFTYMAQTAMPTALDSGAIQAYFASAPYWTVPVIKKTAIVWISGPKGELPPEVTPVTSSVLQVMRSYAVANPDIIKRLVATFSEFAKAVNERPAEVKAATEKVFPDLSPETIDLFLASEATAWTAKPLTAQDLTREIAFIKLSGTPLPNLDSLNPAKMVLP